MNRTLKDDIIGFVFLVAVVLGLFGIVGIFFHSSSELKNIKTWQEKESCSVISKEKTGKKVYCGKACWKEEIRTEYSCKAGIKVVIN